MDAGVSQMGIRLSEVLPQRTFYWTEDIQTSSCCTKPAQCQAGDLFVATVRADHDGHDDVVAALERGARAVVCERLLPLEVPQCVVPNAKAALAAICHGLAGYPSQTLPVIGIAGTYGLTPCQWLTERVLTEAQSLPAGYSGLAYSSGFGPVPRASTVLSAPRHAQWLATALADGCTHAVAEMPRSDVANHTFAGTELQTLVLTRMQTLPAQQGVTPRTNAYFARLLERLGPEGLLVANGDCPAVNQLLRDVERPALTVSLQNHQADLTATILEQSPSEQTFTLQAGYDTVAVRTRIVGASHVQACLLATATALSQGVDLTTIVRGLEAVEEIPGHLQRVECGQPFSVFVDGATSSWELQHTLRTVRKVTRKRVLCVIGPGDAVHAKTRWRRGRVAERYSDLPILTEDTPTDREPLQTAHELLDGFRQPAKAHVCPNRMHAIEWALQQCEPGDSLVLIGPHNRRLVLHEDEFPSDADTAKFWLYESSSGLIRDWALPRK